MKLVREHINEKFSEAGDPVHDMGIGPKGMIEEIKNKQRKKGDTSGVMNYILTNESMETARMLLEYWFKNEEKIDEYDFNTIFTNMQLDRSLISDYREYILPVFINAAIGRQDQRTLDLAMFECANKNFTEEVIELVKGGANPTMRSNEPIALAIRHRNKEMFDVLAQYIKWKPKQKKPFKK